MLLSSLGHMRAPKGGIDFDNLSGDKGYHSWEFYGQAKLANLLTSNELARRLEGSRASSNALHPGVIGTNLDRYNQSVGAKLIYSLAKPFKRTLEQGAATQCYLAAHPNLNGISGNYFSDCNPKKASRHGRDPQLARRLWDVSEELAKGFL